MDEDQTVAYNIILEGHNICLTGQARTGKSFVIRKIVGELRKRGIRVALTCSTGIGTIVFESLQACTLHKWASLEDKCILAKRTQYPLKLACSMTIQKSQGMTLDSSTVDSRNVSNPGQICVAVGRVRSTEGLCVKNFRQTLCKFC